LAAQSGQSSFHPYLLSDLETFTIQQTALLAARWCSNPLFFKHAD
jgi:hypothetical protein